MHSTLALLSLMAQSWQAGPAALARHVSLLHKLQLQKPLRGAHMYFEPHAWHLEGCRLLHARTAALP